MMPVDVLSSQLEVYWNDSPGRRSGCSPTTPRPRTSCVWPVASVITQCRLSSWMLSSPSLLIRTVYVKNHSCSNGWDLSGAYWDSTSTRTLFVMPPTSRHAAADLCFPSSAFLTVFRRVRRLHDIK